MPTCVCSARPVSSRLEAALDRPYSASPAKSFFTGGGLHTFANFDPDDDARVMTVREAFYRSVNLVFIRLMRDLVRAHVFAPGRPAAAVLARASHPMRRPYLERFAEREGRVFLQRYYAQYRKLGPGGALDALLARRLPTPVSFQRVAALFERHDPRRVSLHDRAFVAGVHPLELWLVAYLQRRPDASLDEVLQASADARQDAYQCLFTTRHKPAQDVRIRTVLEADAFEAIHRGWVRLGYPFDRLVLSYATAIGSSGDNPAALAELMGIIVNDGVRQPTERIRRLRVAAGTPYETIVVPRGREPERVLRPEIAQVVRRALVGVVEGGTAVRARGAWVDRDGRVATVGGKTGTGDNRIELGGPSGRRERVMNRTAAFVFFVGDRLYGTIVAYVPGDAAAAYQFTSALPVQVFNLVVPMLKPLAERAEEAEAQTGRLSTGPDVVDRVGEGPL